MIAKGPDRQLPVWLFVGLAVASIGGPLALGALYAPGAAGDALPSIGLASALAVAAFAAPLAVWRGYSRQIASSGGLTAFVRAAAGIHLARAQALVWTVSYALYLPFTVTFVVYELLPAVFPGAVQYQTAIQLALPVAIVALVLLPVARVVAVLAALAAIQLALMLVLGAVTLGHASAATSSFASHASASAIGHGAAGISLLFVCASLPLFLGAEVRGGTRAIRSSLLVAFVAVAACFLFVVFPLSGVPLGLLEQPIPGMAIARAYSGEPLATTIGLATMCSVSGLIVAEYLALGRLIHYLFAVSVRSVLIGIALPFVAVDAISLLDPLRFYADLLRPALIALYLAQLVVVAVYPLYRRRLAGRFDAPSALVAACASGLMGYGLYVAITGPLGT